MVKIFMENSATLSIDLNAKDIIGQTAFHSACASGRFNVAKIFIENSANLSFDFNAYDNVGHTAFNWACSFGNINVVKMFMQNYAIFNIDPNDISQCRREWLLAQFFFL